MSFSKLRLPNAWATNAAALLLFAFPLFAISVRHWASSIFYLLALLALYPRRERGPALRPEEKLFIGVIVLYLVSTLISNTLSGWTRPSIRWYEADFRLLLAIPVFMLVRSQPSLSLALLRGVPIAGLFAGAYALHWASQGAGRPEGPYGPIFIGNLAALFAIVSVAALRHPTYSLPARLPLHLLGAAMGLVAALLSGTRSAWLAAVVGVPLACFFILSPDRRRRNQLGIAVLALSGLAAVAGGIAAPVVKDRLQAAIAETANYVKAESASERKVAGTSTAFRLEQWRGALMISADFPFFGLGVGNAGRELNRHVDAGKLDQAVYVQDAYDERGSHSHLHSAYFDALVFKGGVGLVMLLLLLYVPAAIALSRSSRACPAGGLVVVNALAFGIFSLTEDPFIRNNFTSMYALFTLCAVTLLAAERRCAGAFAAEATGATDRSAPRGYAG